jgi:hypothetical protein
MSTKIEDKDSSPRCAVSPGSVTYALFKHMFDEHGLTLLESEMSEIVRIVNDNLEARLRWWITNAEDIAKERGELFRAGEAMRAIVMCYAWDCDEVGAWDAAAQPIRDMLSSPNEPDEPQAAANPQRKIFPMTHEKGQAGPVGSMAGINKIVAAWRDMPAAEMRLRCGELKAQEIRTVRAVLNAILASAEVSRGAEHS